MQQTAQAQEEKSPEQAAEAELIAIARALVLELNPRKSTAPRVTANSRLDKDLGFDSLGRAELVMRLEQAFGVRLPETLLSEAETISDFVGPIVEAEPDGDRKSTTVPVAAALDDVNETPDEAVTLTEALDWHVARHPDRLHITLLESDRDVAATFTYKQLADASREVAHGLRARGITPGDRIALMLPTGEDFFISYFGILYAGAVPVPIYPPVRPSQLEEHMLRQAAILENAGAQILITVEQARTAARILKLQVESLREVETAERLRQNNGSRLPELTDGEATAFIQYTSGSTGSPKGVVLSHHNLLTNIRAMQDALDATAKDVFVSWLPLYHDMGLIGAWLGSLYVAMPLYIMSPIAFLTRPANWLWTIHRYRGTISAGPNFAYEFCVSRLSDEQLEGLDLSSLKHCLNGAEPVSMKTLNRFIERFSEYGLNPEAIAPVYGLAENSVGLAFPPRGRPPLVDRVDREALAKNGIAKPVDETDETALSFPSVGVPILGHEVRIVDDTGRELPERRQGRLQFRGPSATRGYFRNPEATRALFAGDWLDSADRAYMAGGEIYITGRIKDIIIRGGRNIYPHELEEAAGAIPGVRKGCVAVFGSPDPETGTERLVVLAETREKDEKELASIRQQISEVSVDLLSMPAEIIVLAPPGTVPKTSSGKIRRASARELFESGMVGKSRGAVWWQFVRLGVSGVFAKLRRTGRALADFAYAVRWWLSIGGAFFFLFFATLLTPGLERRWRVSRAAARAALKLAGVPVSYEGLENIPDGGGVLTCNHASYTDSFVLAAALPGAPALVAKKELEGQLFAGTLLKRHGVIFVERFETEGSIADADAVGEAAKAGKLVVIFPEGSLSRKHGLRPFRLGAFVTAAKAGVPVIPAGLRGTRSLLQPEQWHPHRASVELEIATPIQPQGTGFSDAVALRKEVRARMLELCGGADLGRE